MIASIIIPTYNRLTRLKHVIAGLERQDIGLEDFEVLVISDGSTDGTDPFLRSIQTPLQLKPLFQKNQGAAVARNTGVNCAEGEIILFVDDDVVPSPCLLSEHLSCHHASSSPVVVLGPMLTPPGYSMAPWVEWEQAMLQKQYTAMQNGLWEPTARQFFTGNTSLPRKFILETGGFDPSFHRAEDVELAYRLAEKGLRFTFNPQAVGYHYADRSFASWIATPYAYGVNDVIFHQQKGQTWLLPTVGEEFKHRNAFIRGLTQMCLDRPSQSRAAILGLKQAALVSHRLGLYKLSNMAFSGIFNLRYYQGIADKVGGRKMFFTWSS